VRETVQQLSAAERNDKTNPDPQSTTTSQGRPRYGSRKRFFSYVWATLRNTTVTAEEADTIGATVDEKSEQKQPEGSDDEELEKIIRDADIVTLQDRHLVPDTTLIAMAQMKICALTADDQVGRCKDHKLGFLGLCCKWCGGKAGKPGYGRYFPSSLRSLAQADSCQQIVKHASGKCTLVPTDIRRAIVERQLQNTKEDHRIKYGARKIFFKRVWQRLHGDAEFGDAKEDDGDEAKPKADDKNDDEETPWELIIGGSLVVTLEDQGLISDAQLAAMAQMKFCRLTEADRIGWFKSRPVGYPGLCCRQ